MRLNLFILGLVIATGLALTYGFERLPPPAAKNAADFAFTDMNNQRHKLSDFKNQVVVLNFWASWCAPCVEEFPRLIEAAQNNSNITLIALSSDIDKKAVQNFITKHKIPAAKNIFIALDEQDITGKLYQTFMLPETYVLDGNLKIRKKFVGAEWSADNLQQAIANAAAQ